MYTKKSSTNNSIQFEKKSKNRLDIGTKIQKSNKD